MIAATSVSTLTRDDFRLVITRLFVFFDQAGGGETLRSGHLKAGPLPPDRAHSLAADAPASMDEVIAAVLSEEGVDDADDDQAIVGSKLIEISEAIE